MPKNSKPDEFDDECLPGGPNGWCKRHRYPWAVCAAVAARRAEEGAVMVEMTPERNWTPAVEPLAALRAARAEVAAYAAHEEQTHRILGAILGTDDSLEACAWRMKARAERAEELLTRLTREVERLRETLLAWQKRDGNPVYDDEDNRPTLCVCEWAADREAVLRAGHGHVCTLVRAALTALESCQDRPERIRRAQEEMRAPKDVDAASIATNAVDAALTPPAPEG